MSNHSSALAQNITTKEEAAAAIEELEEFQRSVFTLSPNSPKLTQLMENMNPGLVTLLKPLVNESSLKSGEFSKVTQELIKQLKNLPVLRLTIAFEPSKDFLNKLTSWVRKKTNLENIILDITVNTEVVGGAIIEYQGKYFDETVSKEIKKLDQDFNQ